MRKLSLASAIAAACLFTAFTASAADVSTSVDVEILVQNECAIGNQGMDLLDFEMGGFYLSGNNVFQPGTRTQTAGIVFGCNTGVPFTIETNTGPQGTFALTSAEGATIPAQVLIGSDHYDGIPFGTVANGEHFSAVATGERESLEYVVAVNYVPGSFDPLPAPAAGNYDYTLTFTLNY